MTYDVYDYAAAKKKVSAFFLFRVSRFFARAFAAEYLEIVRTANSCSFANQRTLNLLLRTRKIDKKIALPFSLENNKASNFSFSL